MTWELVASLIENIGIPATQKMIALWEQKVQVTSQNFADLIALESQTARDRMMVVLTAQGIDPASPQGLALLALNTG